MRNKKIGTWIARLLITMLTVLGLGQTMVHAVEVADPAEHSTDVIITKVETNDEAKDMTLEQLAGGINVATYFTDGKVLPGVSFTYYKVDSAAKLQDMIDAPGDYDTVADLVGVSGVTLIDDTDETDVNGQVTIPNLLGGFYWVVENTKGTIETSTAVPFALNLPFTNSTGNGYLDEIYVYPKNTLTTDEPDIEKTIEEGKENVAIGDLNIWTVTLDIPVGIEDYDKFSFYDIIDSRLNFEGIEHVMAEADGINLTKGTDYTVAYAAPRLDVVFTELGRIKLKGANPKKVDVTIHTRVNETAIMGQEIPNNATLVFNNGHGVDKNITPENPPSVHTGGKAFVKKDLANGGQVLDGAEFVIMDDDGAYVNLGANGVITFVTDEEDATRFTSDDNGKFEVRGLPYGDYVLIEKVAPQGYALPTNPNTPFEVNETSYNTFEEIEGEISVTPVDPEPIDNRRLVIPQTGGMGTVLFTVVGAVMMLFSALFYKRTKEA